MDNDNTQEGHKHIWNQKVIDYAHGKLENLGSPVKVLLHIGECESCRELFEKEKEQRVQKVDEKKQLHVLTPMPQLDEINEDSAKLITLAQQRIIRSKQILGKFSVATRGQLKGAEL